MLAVFSVVFPLFQEYHTQAISFILLLLLQKEWTIHFSTDRFDFLVTRYGECVAVRGLQYFYFPVLTEP